MAFKEIKLACFSELLNNATAAAKMAQSPCWREFDAQGEGAIEGWKTKAQEISKKLLEADGSEVEYAPKHRGWGGIGKDGKFGARFNGNPSIAPAMGFDELRLAIEALPSQALDLAAQEVAKHLAVPFERGGAQYLAFPQINAGLKSRKTKNGPELSQWQAQWNEMVQTNIDGLRRQWFNGRDQTDETAPSLEALREYWGKANDLVVGGFASRGDEPDQGVHAADRLAGTARSEEPLPAPSQGPDADRSRYWHSHDRQSLAATKLDETPAATRRLGWLALALLLGDKLSPAQAASGHSAPAMSAHTSLGLESAPQKKKGAEFGVVKFNGKARSQRPAISAMQSAMELAEMHFALLQISAGGKEEQRLSRGLAQSGYRFANGQEALEAASLAKKATDLVVAVGEKARLVMEKASQIALSQRDAWLDRQGFGQAIKDARLIEGKENPSARAINWAREHPQAGEAAALAQKDPLLAFATASSRYLGVDAPAGEMVQAARAGWLAKGLSAEAFAQAAKNGPIKTALLEWATREMAAKSRDKTSPRERVERMCAQLSAAFAEGASAKEAKAFVDWCDTQACGFFEPHYYQGSPLRQKITKVMAASAEQSQAALKEAQDKAAGLPWALRAAFRAQSRGEGLGEAPKKDWGQLAVELMRRGCGSEQSMARLDWSKMNASTRWVDLARGAQGEFAAALMQAEQSGPHGVFASRVAGGLGIDSAVDGNELIGKTREALKTQWGVGAGAWKALGQADAKLVERLGSAIESRHGPMLERLGAWLIEQRKAREQTQAQLGLGFEMLGWIGQHGLSADWVETLDELSRRPGRPWALLSPTARPMEVDSTESASLALAEARAKQERLPRIAKSLAERLDSLEKAAAKQNEKNPREAAKQRVAGELDLVDDWLRACEDGVWQTLPLKGGFGDLMRRQQQWHEDVAAKTAAGGSKAKWESPMEKFEREGWEATLLGRATDLTEEGRAMRHCVSSYASNCKAGTSRIFSVKLNGERVCTLELGLHAPGGSRKDYKHGQPQPQDEWKIVQNKGSCNQAVSGAAAEFSKKVAAQMNEAHAKWCLESEAKRSEAAKKAAQTRRKVVMLEEPQASAPQEPAAQEDPAQAGEKKAPPRRKKSP